MNKKIELKDLNEKLDLENITYDFDINEITSSIEIKGSEDATLTLCHPLNIYIPLDKDDKEIKVVFSNIHFDATDKLKDSEEENIGLINIGYSEEEECSAKKIKVIFDHCTFYGFQNEKVCVLCLGNQADVELTTTDFSADRYGVIQSGNSNVLASDCYFDAIFDSFYKAIGQSTFSFQKCKMRIDNDCFISIEDESNGSFENCKFTAPFIKPEEKDVEKYESENPTAIQDYNFYAITSTSSGKINIFNCQFNSFCFALFLMGNKECQINLVDSKIKNCYVGIWASSDTKLRIVNSQIEGCYKDGIIASENSIIDSYDSNFIKTTGNAISLCDNVKASFNDCKLSQNFASGITSGEDVDLTLHSCSLHKNNATAIISEGSSLLNVTKCSFNDNETFNALIGGEVKADFEDCSFLATKKNREQIEHFHLATCGNAKLHVENSTFSSNNKEFNGFFTTDNSDVYVCNSKFLNLKQLAILNKTSKIYIKDSDLKDIDNPIAKNEEDAKLEMVGCGGSLYE